MTRKIWQWIAFAIVILPTSGLSIALISGMYISRDEMRDFLLIFYVISIVLILFSLFLPKKVGKQ